MDINRSGSSGNLARAASLDSRGAGPSEPSARPLGGKRTAAEALLPAPGRQPASALRTSAAPAIGTLAALQSFLNASAPAPLSHENAQRLLINEEAHAANMAGLGAMLAEPASHDEVMDVMVSPPFPSEMPGELADLALLQYEGLRGEMGAAIAASPTGAPLHAADLTHLLDTVFEEPLPNEPRLDGTSLANVFDELAEPAAALPPLPPPPPVPHQVAPVNFGELGADMQDVVLQAMHQGRAEHVTANGVAFEAFLQDAADPFNIDVAEELPLALQQHVDMPVPLPVHVYVPIPLPELAVAPPTDAQMEALLADAAVELNAAPQPMAAPLPQDAPARPSTPELKGHMSRQGRAAVLKSVQHALADSDIQQMLAARGIALDKAGVGGHNIGRELTLTPLLEAGISNAKEATDPSTAPMAAALFMAFKISQELRNLPAYDKNEVRLTFTDGTPRNLGQQHFGGDRNKSIYVANNEAAAINKLAVHMAAAASPGLSPAQRNQVSSMHPASIFVFQQKLDDMIIVMGERGKQAAAFISVAVPVNESQDRQYASSANRANHRQALLEAVKQWPDSLQEMIVAAHDEADPLGALQLACDNLKSHASAARADPQSGWAINPPLYSLLNASLHALQKPGASGSNPVLDWLRSQPVE